jgi:hypothetical protein
MERLVDPILTDVRLECQGARRSGHLWASRWRLVTGVLVLIKALAVYACIPREWPAADRRALARTIGYAALTTAAAMLMFIVPPLSQWPDRIFTAPFMLAFYLMPQAFLVALPIGLLFGVLYGLHDARLSLRSAAAVLIVAAACSAASLAAFAWVVPLSNQAFRVAVMQNLAIARGANENQAVRVAMQNPPIARGANELTFGELRRRIRSDREWGHDSTANAMIYHSRWALAAAPSVVVMWALLLLGRGFRQRWLLALVAFATCAGYAGLMNAGRAAALSGTLPPMAGAWIANLAFMAITIRLAATTVVPRLTTGNVERRT